MAQEKRIARSLLRIIGTVGNFKLAGDSKGYWHRRKATGRFLGVVGFLLGNPRRLFFYQKFSV